MSALSISSPFVGFTGLDGTPLEDGRVFIGVENQNPETNPVAVYWDEALTQPAEQPLKTLAGYISRNGTPANVFTGANYSITVRSKDGSFVFSSLSNNLFTSLSQLVSAEVYSDLSNTSDPAKGDALVGVKRTDAGAVPTNLHLWIQSERKNLWDFLSVDQRNDVESGAGIVDTAAALTSAVGSFSSRGGILELPEGRVRLNSSVSINKPIHIEGCGAGSYSQPVVTPGTEILWGGGSSDVLNIGGFGSMISGGGLHNLAINGMAVASRCLHTKDIQRLQVENLSLTGAVSDAWKLSNTLGLDPTGFFIVDDIRIFLRGGATNNANGINIAGVTTPGVDGVTLCRFSKARIEHANGAGIVVGQAGDAFIWEGLQTFRADVETGPGVWFATTAGGIVGYHLFLNPLVNAGFRFDTAGLHLGTKIINANHTDIATGIVMLYGAGAADVEMETSLGFKFGRSLIPDLHNTFRADSMSLMRFDSTNSLLHTSSGCWKTSVPAGGNLSSSDFVGSGVAMDTGPTLNNTTTIYDTSTLGAGNGIGRTHSPAADFIINPVDLANIRLRVGFVDGVGDSPTNGVYVEYNPLVNSNWRLICRSGGVETAVVSALAGFSARIEWYIFFNDNGASFFYRVEGNRSFGFGGTINTNIPFAGCSTFAQVKTLAASSKRFDIYSIKLGHIDECLP